MSAFFLSDNSLAVAVRKNVESIEWMTTLVVEICCMYIYSRPTASLQFV